MRALLAAALTVFASGCATVAAPPHAQDPWETYNRGAYAFNDALDRAVLKPAAQSYAEGVPEFAQEGVMNSTRR